MHSAEENHSYSAKEEEEEENGTADRAEWEEPKVWAIHRIAITIPATIHHRWNGRSLSIFSGLGYGSCHCGSLNNSLCNTGSISHEAARGDQSDEEHRSNNTKNETVAKHFYLQ
jgi:hypothetical protein